MQQDRLPQISASASGIRSRPTCVAVRRVRFRLWTRAIGELRGLLREASIAAQSRASEAGIQLNGNRSRFGWTTPPNTAVNSGVTAARASD